MELDAYWLWAALGIALIGLEVGTATFYLLWPGVAALVLALVTYFAPEFPLAGQIALAAVLATIFTTIGRFYFGVGGGRQDSDRPLLNRRDAQMVGTRAIAARDFVGGQGPVRIGDTQWSARLVQGRTAPVHEGAELVVAEVRGALVIVDLA